MNEKFQPLLRCMNIVWARLTICIWQRAHTNVSLREYLNSILWKTDGKWWKMFSFVSRKTLWIHVSVTPTAQNNGMGKTALWGKSEGYNRVLRLGVPPSPRQLSCKRQCCTQSASNPLHHTISWNKSQMQIPLSWSTHTTYSIVARIPSNTVYCNDCTSLYAVIMIRRNRKMNS